MGANFATVFTAGANPDHALRTTYPKPTTTDPRLFLMTVFAGAKLWRFKRYFLRHVCRSLIRGIDPISQL